MIQKCWVLNQGYIENKTCLSLKSIILNMPYFQDLLYPSVEKKKQKLKSILMKLKSKPSEAPKPFSWSLDDKYCLALFERVKCCPRTEAQPTRDMVKKTLHLHFPWLKKNKNNIWGSDKFRKQNSGAPNLKIPQNLPALNHKIIPKTGQVISTLKKLRPIWKTIVLDIFGGAFASTSLETCASQTWTIC